MGEHVRMQPKISKQATQPSPADDLTKRELSYEELKNLTYQYKNQVEYLENQVKQLNYNGLLQQLNFMFKVLEFPDYFTPEYLDKCSEMIVKMLAIPEVAESTEAAEVKE